MTDHDLIRFVDAQDQVYAQVVGELTHGRKQTHWMWFVFPQLAGLGRSGMAKRYLADSILGPRLLQVVKLLLDQKGKSAFEILGSPDDLKLRSCLTLFREAASKESDREFFGKALDQFYRGQPDGSTLELLNVTSENARCRRLAP